jgi:precorrin-4 methylase
MALARMEGAVATESLSEMLEEIATGLKSGDEEIFGWLREQLKECGATDISVELAMGVITRLLPEEAQACMHVATQQARRWAH